MNAGKAVADFFVEALMPDWLKLRLARAKPLDPAGRWALAASAQLTDLNRHRHDTLNPDPRVDSAQWAMNLSSWWGTEDHDETVAMLEWLAAEGHRVKFRAAAGHDVLAWDLARLINVARWGYAARHLSEAEAWAHILPAAAALRERYRSWDELAGDYVLGHDLWAEGPDEDLTAVTARLLDPANGKSPWNGVAWTLGGTAG